MLSNGTSIGIPIDLSQNARIRSDPYKRLGAAILLRAIEDACSPYSIFEGGFSKESACEFLLKDNDDFPLWCIGLGLDPRLVRSKVRNLIRKSKEAKHGQVL